MILKNFDEEQISLIAIKILVTHAYRKTYDLNLLEEANKEYLINSGVLDVFDDNDPDSAQELLDILKTPHPWKFDIKEDYDEVSNYLGALKNRAHIKHKVILDVVINKKVKFACNVQIVPKFNYNGTKLINDLSNANSMNKKFGGIYVIVYPLEDKTKVLVYYRKKYSAYESVLKEFDKMILDEKLQAISNLLIIYTDMFVFNKEISIDVMKLSQQFAYIPTEEDNVENYIKHLHTLEDNINLFKY